MLLSIGVFVDVNLLTKSMIDFTINIRKGPENLKDDFRIYSKFTDIIGEIRHWTYFMMIIYLLYYLADVDFYDDRDN